MGASWNLLKRNPVFLPLLRSTNGSQLNATDRVRNLIGVPNIKCPNVSTLVSPIRSKKLAIAVSTDAKGHLRAKMMSLSDTYDDGDDMASRETNTEGSILDEPYQPDEMSQRSYIPQLYTPVTQWSLFSNGFP